MRQWIFRRSSARCYDTEVHGGARAWNWMVGSLEHEATERRCFKHPDATMGRSTMIDCGRTTVPARVVVQQIEQW
jgi:hypothetical protein